ncbi:hypothetical protein [Leptothoe sp. PORK10 BA2]|uniref:hypothetical protein n=1 Tax=Leptothoe sp. PORK10 BA2 TaxID=3110254 RepID=UPI002B216BBD|nr:hypothetical protein [Leptothoe sp. PORK10 BA2]MEA5464517.1 hypothetical protein [Leptothoe sp. PORK10 BA2]
MGSTTVLDAMKLPELKKRVKRTWDILQTGFTVQSGQFEQEVRAFGDRRYKKTWVAALCRFEAMFAIESCLDSWMLLTNTFAFRPERWDYEYRHQIFDEFLMYPEALEAIKTGLEDLFSKDLSNTEREQADGFFRLLEEREGSNRTIGFPARPIRELAGISTAA